MSAERHFKNEMENSFVKIFENEPEKPELLRNCFKLLLKEVEAYPENCTATADETRIPGIDIWCPSFSESLVMNREGFDINYNDLKYIPQPDYFDEAVGTENSRDLYGLDNTNMYKLFEKSKGTYEFVLNSRRESREQPMTLCSGLLKNLEHSQQINNPGDKNDVFSSSPSPFNQSPDCSSSWLAETSMASYNCTNANFSMVSHSTAIGTSMSLPLCSVSSSLQRMAFNSTALSTITAATDDPNSRNSYSSFDQLLSAMSQYDCLMYNHFVQNSMLEQSNQQATLLCSFLQNRLCQNRLYSVSVNGDLVLRPPPGFSPLPSSGGNTGH